MVMANGRTSWVGNVMGSLIVRLVCYYVVLVGAIFSWYFLFILIFLIVGIGALIWVRFYRFPPYIQAYNEQLRRAHAIYGLPGSHGPLTRTIHVWTSARPSARPTKGLALYLR